MTHNDRPTPEQIVMQLISEGHNPNALMVELRRHGYVIVHPDDVPVTFPAPESLFGCTFDEAFEFGCRKMRSHIFGDDR